MSFISGSYGQYLRQIMLAKWAEKVAQNLIFPVADPGFPEGGRGPHRGAWTPEAVTFRKICKSKRKKSGRLGGPCAGHAPSRSATVSITTMLYKNSFM